MDEVLRLLQSPAFWIGSVIVGIVINVMTTYWVRWMDRAWPHWRERWRKRKELDAADFAAQVDFLRNEKIPLNTYFYLLRSIDRKLDSIYLLALGLIIMGVAGVLFGTWAPVVAGCAAFPITIAVMAMRGADRMTKTVEQANTKPASQPAEENNGKKPETGEQDQAQRIGEQGE